MDSVLSFGKKLPNENRLGGFLLAQGCAGGTMESSMQSSYDWKKIAIAGVGLVVIVGLVVFFVMRGSRSNPTDTQPVTDLFPYGTTTGGETQAGNPPTVATPPSADVPLENPITMQSSQALRQITNYPVTNAYAWVGNKTIREPKIDTKTGTTTLVAREVPTNYVTWNVKQTGIVMEAEVSEASIIQKQKTLTQIPGAEEVWFGNAGSTMIYRLWNDAERTIDSFRITIPKKNQTAAWCTVTFDKDLKQGSKGPQVAELQKYINQKIGLSLASDGSFGSKTATALKRIQEGLLVAQTGIMDQATRNAINIDCAAVRNASIAAENDPVKVDGSFIATNILRGDLIPGSSTLVYLLKSPTGVAGYVANADGSKPKKIFDSEFTEWMPQWVNATTIAMTTLASREADGYLYVLNPANGNFKKILGPIRGLTTTMAPDAKTVFMSASTDTGFASALYRVDTGTISKIDLAALASQCTWASARQLYCAVPQTVPQNKYPDAWYQGIVSFNDALWSIDVATGTTQVILVPPKTLDMTHLVTSPDGNYLYFINKTDGTLWSLKLK